MVGSCVTAKNMATGDGFTLVFPIGEATALAKGELLGKIPPKTPVVARCMVSIALSRDTGVGDDSGEDIGDFAGWLLGVRERRLTDTAFARGEEAGLALWDPPNFLSRCSFRRQAAQQQILRQDGQRHIVPAGAGSSL